MADSELVTVEAPKAAVGTKSSWRDRFKITSAATEKANVKRFFALNTWHYLIILGIAISGLAAFINTYNAISGINESAIACTQGPEYSRQLNVKFIVITVLSAFLVLLGLLLAFFFRGARNQRRLVTLGIITAGIFGIIYALSIRFNIASIQARLIASWVTFFGFLLLGWFMSNRGRIKVLEN